MKVLTIGKHNYNSCCERTLVKRSSLHKIIRNRVPKWEFLWCASFTKAWGNYWMPSIYQHYKNAFHAHFPPVMHPEYACCWWVYMWRYTGEITFPTQICQIYAIILFCYTQPHLRETPELSTATWQMYKSTKFQSIPKGKPSLKYSQRNSKSVESAKEWHKSTNPLSGLSNDGKHSPTLQTCLPHQHPEYGYCWVYMCPLREEESKLPNTLLQTFAYLSHLLTYKKLQNCPPKLHKCTNQPMV